MNFAILSMVLVPGTGAAAAFGRRNDVQCHAFRGIAPCAALPALILAVFAPTGASLHLLMQRGYIDVDEDAEQRVIRAGVRVVEAALLRVGE